MENFKTQEKTYYLDNITIVPRGIVFIVIARRYSIVSNKTEHKYFPKTLTSVIVVGITAVPWWKCFTYTSF